MKKRIIFGCVFIALMTCLSAFTGEIVREFNAPGTCPTGLTYDGKHLWLADRKADKLFCIDPKSGKVVRSLDSPA
ncbi:MAG: hypothetical protein JXR87_04105, partial [Candidatus Marinimicrobia bacterium]|nr:hypothetical protein [Candidatus Neomarinimicrobiota bacterium]